MLHLCILSKYTSKLNTTNIYYFSGSELLQLQSELTRLADPADPVQVVDYLSLRCQVAYLQHNLSIRHNLRKALIMTGNVYAAKVSMRYHTCIEHIGEVKQFNPALALLTTITYPCNMICCFLLADLRFGINASTAHPLPANAMHHPHPPIPPSPHHSSTPLPPPHAPQYQPIKIL